MSPSSLIKTHRRSLIYLIILVLIVYVLVPQLKSFKSSWHLLSHPKIGLASLAFIFVLTTFLSGALTIYLLSFKRLNYLKTLTIQLAASFINHLLPAGAGALSVNFLYLKRSRQSTTEAVAVMGVNNSLGIIGHFLIVVITLLVFPAHLTLHTSSVVKRLIVYILILIGLGLVLATVLGRRHLRALLGGLVKTLARYRHRRLRLTLSLLSSAGLTLANVAAFYFCCQAVGVNVNFEQAIIIFTLGVSAGTATPTPGGLGGFEAGLTVGLVGFGTPSSLALAAALLFRLLSFWLPIVLGAAAFTIVNHQNWLAPEP